MIEAYDHVDRPVSDLHNLNHGTGRLFKQGAGCFGLIYSGDNQGGWSLPDKQPNQPFFFLF